MSKVARIAVEVGSTGDHVVYPTPRVGKNHQHRNPGKFPAQAEAVRHSVREGSLTLRVPITKAKTRACGG